MKWAVLIAVLVLGGGLGQMAVLMPKVDDAEARREGFGSRAEFLAAWRSMHADYTGPVWRVEVKRLEAPNE
jgi:hypothetical protein